MKLLIGIFAGIFALSVTSQAATVHHKTSTKPVSKGPALISEVKSVKLSTSMLGRIVTINAAGTVTTGGWTGAELTPQTTSKPPADGVYTLEFRATKPAKITDQKKHSITAKLTWWNPPAKLKAVRVVAKRNSIVQRFAKTTKKATHHH